ncbi:MAG: adenylosuccinate synthetase, partial [Thermodesulfobacteriota bacterium]
AEYGATTGRPRRCGWFDAVALRHAARVNGFDALAITKLDVLDNFEEIKICTAYKYKRKKMTEFPTSGAVLGFVEPVYETMPGWMASTSKIKKFKDLPKNARAYLNRLEKLTGISVNIISVGAGRKEVIVRKNPFR